MAGKWVVDVVLVGVANTNLYVASLGWAYDKFSVVCCQCRVGQILVTWDTNNVVSSTSWWV
jgi:hypothetical protein